MILVYSTPFCTYENYFWKLLILLFFYKPNGIGLGVISKTEEGHLLESWTRVLLRSASMICPRSLLQRKHWQFLKQTESEPMGPMSQRNGWERLANIKEASKKGLWILILLFAWKIWKEMNQRVFGLKETVLPSLMAKIKKEAKT